MTETAFSSIKRRFANMYMLSVSKHGKRNYVEGVYITSLDTLPKQCKNDLRITDYTTKQIKHILYHTL